MKWDTYLFSTLISLKWFYNVPLPPELIFICFYFSHISFKKKVLNRFISAKTLLYKLVIVLCVLSPILMIQTAATWLRPVAPPPGPAARSTVNWSRLNRPTNLQAGEENVQQRRRTEERTQRWQNNCGNVGKLQGGGEWLENKHELGHCALNYKRKLKSEMNWERWWWVKAGLRWSMRAAAVDEALVDPLNHWLTQTGKSIGPEGTRSLQARQSITRLHTAKTHSFNGVWSLALNASVHICIDVPAFKKKNKKNKPKKKTYFQECRKWRLETISLRHQGLKL